MLITYEDLQRKSLFTFYKELNTRRRKNKKGERISLQSGESPSYGNTCSAFFFLLVQTIIRYWWLILSLLRSIDLQSLIWMTSKQGLTLHYPFI